MKKQDIETQDNLYIGGTRYGAIALYLQFLANRSRLKPQESGFSLLESLIAVAVVSILIVAIAPMIALSTSARINARRIDQATQAARSYVDAVRGGVIDTVAFPTNLIRNTPNAQGQYTFEAIAPPTNVPTLAASSTCSQVNTAVLGSAAVLGTCVDVNANGFSVNDPQDLFIQPMRSGPTDPSELRGQGYWLAVRVYRSDALTSASAIRTGTEESCNSGANATAFSSTSSITCPIVTIRSQIPPVGSSININEVSKGIGSN
ncbi:prepilin-type N-terminal cleavage/methylation domain-containing protein [Pseudanabaena mucicola]|uniref:Type II secretion system protein n=1 Tax=Pseudanabaena mucicola FACHB-723 TaxID=2692860 RepID=A0ABR7ZYR1_9CYAN|nr:prepilin-type N-terminal cleavage/methylation domain-containing protein [Pseudanabaena mucicola]MBD2188950.1 type II secretion system protein [Pseudanabaena mucicola FACHB-723]